MMRGLQYDLRLAFTNETWTEFKALCLVRITKETRERTDLMSMSRPSFRFERHMFAAYKRGEHRILSPFAVTDHPVYDRYYPHRIRENTSEVVHRVREYAGGGPTRFSSIDVICEMPDGRLPRLSVTAAGSTIAAAASESLACPTLDPRILREFFNLSTYAVMFPAFGGRTKGAVVRPVAGKDCGSDLVAGVPGSRAARRSAVEGGLVEGDS